ncbi:flagellin [Natrialba sp. SSL1]|uniref:flagellin n=1 Tax=Natrialba sp. SSL1 TaxID=1869245 RepID=UPI00209B858F|nr:flagellin [Natrialba sp. SSL1]
MKEEFAVRTTDADRTLGDIEDVFYNVDAESDFEDENDFVYDIVNDATDIGDEGSGSDYELDGNYAVVDLGSLDEGGYAVEIIGLEAVTYTVFEAGDEGDEDAISGEGEDVLFYGFGIDQVSNLGDFENRVDELQFVAATAPGSNPIDLEQTSVQFIGEQGADSVAISDARNVNDIQGVTDGVLTDSTDRAEVTFRVVGEIDNYNRLSEGERLSVIFTTDSGATTETELRVPTTITNDDESVRL